MRRTDKGFCFFYDWLDDLDHLDGADAWRVTRAIGGYYRNGQNPIEAVDEPLRALVSVIYHQIERMEEISAIRQRNADRTNEKRWDFCDTLRSQNVAKRSQNEPLRSQCDRSATPIEREKKEAKKREITNTKTETKTFPLSVGEGETRAPAHAETPPPRERVIEDLRSEGIPSLYVAERYARAIERGGNIEEILRSWWASDRTEWEKLHGSEIASFDTDAFFEAALRKSYGDQYDEIYGRSVMV